MHADAARAGSDRPCRRHKPRSRACGGRRRRICIGRFYRDVRSSYQCSAVAVAPARFDSITCTTHGSFDARPCPWKSRSRSASRKPRSAANCAIPRLTAFRRRRSSIVASRDKPSSRRPTSLLPSQSPASRPAGLRVPRTWRFAESGDRPPPSQGGGHSLAGASGVQRSSLPCTSDGNRSQATATVSAYFCGSCDGVTCR